MPAEVETEEVGRRPQGYAAPAAGGACAAGAQGALGAGGRPFCNRLGSASRLGAVTK